MPDRLRHPAEIQRQNDQLLINANLQQIQANQIKVLVLQQAQAGYQLQGNTLLNTQSPAPEAKQCPAVGSYRAGPCQSGAA
ncbi:hypothetical protein SFA35_25475 (plasmid) [Pseudomonas sp. HR96]|uniref:hypothetical protein n=1 Tax=Pseudomonas sp. HR96 TaxID=1027966 RepID=UPI002A75A372|nr:hypothetical protein [Pseudomonas sp. HR96]WPP02511.1 hypothetical protein SFA35_25475 [Pseudomonas sp. HR96]